MLILLGNSVCLFKERINNILLYTTSKFDI